MIRLAEREDMDAILSVYQAARQYMKESGNPTQWGDDYPPQAVLEKDLDRRQLYVDVQEGSIHGVFALVAGEEPTYARIEDGAWKNDAPYVTIHRMAGDGQFPGLFARCFAFCAARADELRIDTHDRNLTMQHLIAKHGFERCGMIYVQDGTPRIAYQYSAHRGE